MKPKDSNAMPLKAIKPPRGWNERLGEDWVSWRPSRNSRGLILLSSTELLYDDASGDLDIWTRNWKVPKCLPLFRQRVNQLKRLEWK